MKIAWRYYSCRIESARSLIYKIDYFYLDMKLIVEILQDKIQEPTTRSIEFVRALIGTIHVMEDSGEICEINVGIDLIKYIGSYSPVGDDEYVYSEIIGPRNDRKFLPLILMTNKLCSIKHSS